MKLAETHLRKSLGNERLTLLQPESIQEVYRKMLAEKSSARTVQHVHRVLNAVLREAVSAGYLLRNPADGVKLPKIEKKEQRHFSEDEAARFLAACATMRQGLAFELALATGLRPQEYLALKWTDVEFERNTIRIVRALKRYKKEWRFKEPKTAKSRRRVLLPAPLMNKLRLHRKAQLEQQLKHLNYLPLSCNQCGASGNPDITVCDEVHRDSESGRCQFFFQQLTFSQIGISAAKPQQFFMLAAFDDAACFQHANQVSFFHRRDAMGDD